MYSLYIYQKNEKWVLSKGKEATPMFLFKTKEDAKEMALELKGDNETDIYMELRNEKGRVIFAKI